MPDLIWQFRPNHRRPEIALTRFQDWMHYAVFVRHYRNVVAVAARRSGKTTVSRLLCWRWGLDPRAGDIGYMAPTRSQAKRLLWRPLMQDLLDPAARALVREIDKTELAIEFITGTRLYLFSAEAPERIRGEGLKGFLADEADDPKYTHEMFDEAISPALSADEGQLVQMGTPKGRGRLYAEWKKGHPKDPSRIKDHLSCQVDAYAAGIIPRAEIERAERDRPVRAFRQEYLASFEALVGFIYEEFSLDRHVIRSSKLPERFDSVYVVVDWGEASRGTMTLCGEVAPNDEDDLPRVYAIEEHSHAGMPYTSDGWWKIAKKLQREWAPMAWYTDPAQTLARYRDNLAEVVREEAKMRGQRAPRVVGYDNAVKPGISAVQELLHYDQGLDEPPHLFVVNDGPAPCKNLIRTFGSYRWKSVRGIDGEYEESPEKKDDHELDALRGGVFTRHFSKRGMANERSMQGGGW